MQPDYQDLLRDLNLTEKQIESIVELNTQYLNEALTEGDTEYAEYFLWTEGFLK